MNIQMCGGFSACDLEFETCRDGRKGSWKVRREVRKNRTCVWSPRGSGNRVDYDTMNKVRRF
jgi:hypothetical protein